MQQANSNVKTFESAPVTQIELERILIHGILQGQQDLFDALIGPHQGYIFRKAHSILGNAADAEDASQQALLHAFQHLRDFRQQSTFRTWLTRITINEAMARLRRALHHPATSLEQPTSRDGEIAVKDMVADGGMLPLEMLQRQQSAEALRAAVNRLPTRLRTIVLLRDFEQMDTQQTAKHLRVTVTTVKTRHHRARQRLRRLLSSAHRGYRPNRALILPDSSS